MKKNIFIFAVMLVMIAIGLSSDARTSKVAAPTFNTTYVQNKGDIIKLKKCNPKKLQFWSYDESIFIQKNKGSQLVVEDFHDFQGGMTAVEYFYKDKYHQKLVGYGNLIPLDFVVKQGNTKNFFTKKTRKLLNSKNIKFTISDPSVVSISSKGTVKGKKCGSTIVKVKWKKHIGYCKLFVLSTGQKKEEVFSGYMLTYIYQKKCINKDSYKYFVGTKATNEMNSPFTWRGQDNDTVNHDQLKLIIVDKNDKENWDRLIKRNAAAIYRTSINTIIVRKNMATYDVLLHQFGHFLDHRNATNGYAFYSDIPENKDAYYNKYEKEFTNNLGYTPPTNLQGFADAYKFYVVSPFRMKKQMPKTYEWIDNFMKSHGYV